MSSRDLISGHTVVAGIIGDPVVHSRSPAIHNAAYVACGLDWSYVAFPVPAGRGGEAVAAMRTLSIAGLNVTMPHKLAAAAACDEITVTAATLEAVNTVVRRGDRLVGDSTDGDGFVRAFRDEGLDPAGCRVLVLGAGGAARAITYALGAEGAQVTVAARHDDRAQAAALLAPNATTTTFDAQTDELNHVIADADVVVNATPLGMAGESPPFDPGAFQANHVVIDTVYEPLETPMLVAARERGARAVNGIGMLVHQAALAFTQFTGVDAPIEIMRAAAIS